LVLVHTLDQPAQIQKGVSGARSDDTKSLKGVIIDWITPPGQALNPPLMRSMKTDRGFHHECTGAFSLLLRNEARVKEKNIVFV
jgi:hypothetical protein